MASVTTKRKTKRQKILCLWVVAGGPEEQTEGLVYVMVPEGTEFLDQEMRWLRVTKGFAVQVPEESIELMTPPEEES